MRVEALTVFPIKSGAGVSKNRAQVTARGLAEDRRFMVVDEAFRFLTLRQFPPLVTLRSQYLGAGLALEAPGCARLDLALATGPRVEVQVWRDTVEATHLLQADDWLAQAFERKLHLVYLPDAVVRPAGKRAQPGDQVSFADAYPLLLVGEASVRALGDHLGRALEIERFRPNVVVSGLEPFAEHRLGRVRIADLGFRSAGPCERCVAITVDPVTAELAPEVLRGLAELQRSENKPCLGLNLVPEASGEIFVGAPVAVEPSVLV